MELYDYLILLIVLFGNIIGGILFIPKLLGVIVRRSLKDKPNNRSSHSKAVPTAGGILFFAGYIFSIWVLRIYDTDNLSMTYVVCLTIMLFIGLKDDLIGVAPKTKVIAQILVAVIVVTNGHFETLSLNGVFGIYEIPPLVSSIIIIFFFVGYINALNLIDGIDGLAGFIGITIFAFFGLIFYRIGDLFSLGLCLASIGTIVGFLFFNLQKKKKIFMGDTGSLILGFMIVFLTINLLHEDDNLRQLKEIRKENLLFIIYAILFIPIFDTARVFTLRLLQGVSIWKPDKNHIHHIIIDRFKLSHGQTSIAISAFSVIIIISVYVLSQYLTWVSLLVFFVILNSFCVVFLKKLSTQRKPILKKNKNRNDLVGA